MAVIAIIPNILPATLVLGFMGLRSIPLDLMTITIAAITIGIAVDNSIHYILDLNIEFSENKNYTKSVQICHGSIGKAMYYTSSIIVIGFLHLIFVKFYTNYIFWFVDRISHGGCTFSFFNSTSCFIDLIQTTR